VTYVFNKIDLLNRAPLLDSSMPPQVFLSAATGAGIPLLCEHLKQCAGFQNVESGTLSARRRHLEALSRTRVHLSEARRQLIEHRAGEVMAEELRQAQQCLGEITGEVSSDDLLGRIFSSFCIGK
jgi:tRNA modification GTPase